MKKYGVIIGSVILALMIFIIPSNKIEALLLDGVYYDLPDLPTENITENYTIVLDKDSVIRLYYFPDESLLTINDTDNVYHVSGLALGFGGNSYSTGGKTYNIYAYSYELIDNEWVYNDYLKSHISYYLITSDFGLKSTDIYNDPSILKPYLQEKIIYTNLNFMYFYNGEYTQIFSPNDVVKSSLINISSVFSCDLNGNDMEILTIDFSKLLSDNYKYQYGIKRHIDSNIVWHDINELINGGYSFNEYYNGTYIYARVLDVDNNIIEETQYQISNSNLPKFEILIASGLACPIPNYDGDPQAEIINIDFSNVYFENYSYFYSYDGKTKYNLNVTNEQLVQEITEYLYNFIYFYIYDENNNLIYYTYNDVSSSERLGSLPKDYALRHKVLINEGVACDLEGNNIINVSFDFSNITKYVNHYNFDVVINDEHLGAIQSYEMILSELNYLQKYDIKIYIDTFLYYHRNYNVGHVINNEPIQGDFEDKEFEDLYNDMLNNISSGIVEDNETLFNLFVNSLNQFKDVIVDIFNNCSYIFENLSPVLKYFYISVFILILFGFLIRFIL